MAFSVLVSRVLSVSTAVLTSTRGSTTSIPPPLGRLLCASQRARRKSRDSPRPRTLEPAAPLVSAAAPVQSSGEPSDCEHVYAVYRPMLILSASMAKGAYLGEARQARRRRSGGGISSGVEAVARGGEEPRTERVRRRCRRLRPSGRGCALGCGRCRRWPVLRHRPAASPSPHRRRRLLATGTAVRRCPRGSGVRSREEARPAG